MNPDDGQPVCRVCRIDRSVVLEAKVPGALWRCGGCGKMHSVKESKCPVCNAPRAIEGIDRSPRRPERTVRFTWRIRIDRAALLRWGSGVALAVLLAFVAASLLDGSPSRAEVKRLFEATELARINAGFQGDGPGAVEAADRRNLEELRAVTGMIERLARDCGSGLPSAVVADPSRTALKPEVYHANLVQLAGAVDRYLETRIGPFGAGYALKDLKVTGSRKERVGGAARWTVEYEAALTAAADVTVRKPAYLPGQDCLPLVENGEIRWDSYDRFYKAWTDRDSEAGRAAAAAHERARSARICPKGGTQTVNGRLTLEKAPGGWRAIGE